MSILKSLQFFSNIGRTPFSSTMIDVSNDLIGKTEIWSFTEKNFIDVWFFSDLYKDKLNELNDNTKRLLRKMNAAVNLEVAQIKEMLMLKGSLDVVLNMTPYRPSTTMDDHGGGEQLKDLLRAEKSCKLNTKNKFEIFKNDPSSK